MQQQQNKQRRDSREPRAPKEFEEKVIEIKRVTQKKKGGNKISFSALVVIGDRKGRAAFGFNKAPDVMSAIQKSISGAKKHLITIKKVGADTIPHEIYFKYKSAAVLLKPAPEGTGVIAGGPIRSVVEAFGIRNLVSKMMGSNNKTLNVYATFMALESMKSREEGIKGEVLSINGKENAKQGIDKRISDKSNNIKEQSVGQKPKIETKPKAKKSVTKNTVKSSKKMVVKKTK